MTTDSRKVGKDSLYIAIRGTHADGHDFIGEAVERGASAVAAERDVGDIGPPVITARDTRNLASRMLAAFYGGDDAGCRHQTKLIAVTGTNGKTTVTHMIRQILSFAGYKTGIIGTVGCELYNAGHVARYETAHHMTTPPPEEFYAILWDMIRAGADYIVFEASSHGIAQERLAGLGILGCEMSAAVFTNLTPEHMDYHSGMEDYFAVKARLFTEFGAKKKIINVSDAYGRRLYGMCADAVGVDVDRTGSGDVTPCGVEQLGVHGVRYVYTSRDAVFPVSCGVPGRYTAANSAEALACALSLGIDAVTARDATALFPGVRGRMERVRCDTTKFTPPVFIDFAHTPAALEGLLRSVREAAPGKRIVLLFGCGGDRDRTKRAVMGKIASELADYTVITSDNSRSENADDIIAEIMTGFGEKAPHCVITDRRSAIEYAVMNARVDDVIVLAGKGHEDYEESNGRQTHFDEREIVADAVEKRYRQKGAV